MPSISDEIKKRLKPQIKITTPTKGSGYFYKMWKEAHKCQQRLLNTNKRINIIPKRSGLI